MPELFFGWSVAQFVCTPSDAVPLRFGLAKRAINGSLPGDKLPLPPPPLPIIARASRASWPTPTSFL